MIEIICQELRKKRLVIFIGEQKIVYEQSNVHFFKKTTNINSYRYYYIYIKTIQCYTHVKSETIVENCNVSSEVDQQTDHKNHKNRAAKRACTRARAHHSSHRGGGHTEYHPEGRDSPGGHELLRLFLRQRSELARGQLCSLLQRETSCEGRREMDRERSRRCERDGTVRRTKTQA